MYRDLRRRSHREQFLPLVLEQDDLGLHDVDLNVPVKAVRLSLDADDTDDAGDKGKEDELDVHDSSSIASR